MAQAKTPKKVLPKRVTSAKEWKKQTSNYYPLELPSGNTCLVKPIGVDAFLAQGMIPNILISTMMEAVDMREIETSRGPKAAEIEAKKIAAQKAEAAQKALTEDPEKVKAMFTMADSATVYCVVEPVVLPIPTPDENGDLPERDPDALYVDEVDVEDKLYIMSNALSGVRDLEAFRNELSGVVVSPASLEAVAAATQSDSPTD